MAVDVETFHPQYESFVGAKPQTVQSCGTEEIQDQQVDIVDIRAGGKPLDLKQSIRRSLRELNEDGLRSLPSLLLWNEQGLRHFEQVTYTPEYYLTNTEISLLEQHSIQIAHSIEPGTILLELGSGCLRKINILLQAIDALGKQADYYALDLDLRELARTLKELNPSRFKHVSCHGLLGTYDDGKAWLSQEINAVRPKCLLSLGSTMGSFTRGEAGDFLQQWTRVLRQGGDTRRQEQPDAKIIIGLDGCKNEKQVYSAYNDRAGVNRCFILNVIENANSHLGYNAFNQKDWSVKGEWDADSGRHAQYLTPLKDLSFEELIIRRGEKILVVYSYKNDERDKNQLWARSQLKEIARYMSRDGSYGMLRVYFQ
ncbi:histidine-specific methyltransferase [Hypoxylon sp. FL0543]|nr:histidine-specific methyltransferase [Hypoxylon sp. FL0543]